MTQAIHPVQIDTFEYDITVTSANQSFALDESNLPNDIESIVGFVMNSSHPAKFYARGKTELQIGDRSIIRKYRLGKTYLPTADKSEAHFKMYPIRVDKYNLNRIIPYQPSSFNLRWEIKDEENSSEDFTTYTVTLTLFCLLKA